MHVVPVGADSETKHGKPITFQFYSKEADLADILWVKPKTASRSFFAYLNGLPATGDRHYVFFGFNYAFDMVSFFYDRHAVLRDESIKAVWYGWTVNIVYAAVRFAVLTKGKRRVTLIDTAAYFSSPPRPLADLAEIFCPHLPKLKAPEGLGQKDFKKSDKIFCDYAMRDSEIAYHIGLFLLEQHREWDVSLAVSGPHFASKVFRKHFLKKTIPLPPRKIVYAALTSYHGGKNGVTVPPGLYEDIHALDIKSAYPHAMSIMPSFSNPDLYFTISGNQHPTDVPPYGIYKITGIAKECKWPVIFNNKFKPVSGFFSGIWITGFELNEALRAKEVKITSLYGYFYDAEADKEPSPFKGYVDTFYARKEGAKEKPQKEFNKLLMNALYGKFIQTRHLVAGMGNIVYDMDEKKLLEDSSIIAGGLFNPFIATLITGHCRAHVHKLEHKYRALHTATDGIHTHANRALPRAPGKGKAHALGSLSIENSGDVLIMRNKLYVFYRGTTDADRTEVNSAKRAGRKSKVKLSTIRKGKTICKYALHGFHGSVETLEKLWQTGTRDYEYTKVNKLRESIRRNLQVNDFVSTRASLQIPVAGK